MKLRKHNIELLCWKCFTQSLTRSHSLSLSLCIAFVVHIYLYSSARRRIIKTEQFLFFSENFSLLFPPTPSFSHIFFSLFAEEHTLNSSCTHTHSLTHTLGNVKTNRYDSFLKLEKRAHRLFVAWFTGYKHLSVANARVQCVCVPLNGKYIYVYK